MADRPPSLRKQLTSLVFGKKLKAAAKATADKRSEELPRSLREWLATEAVSEQINNAVAEALFAGLSRGRVSLAKEDEIPQLLEQSGGGKQLRALLMQGNVVDTLEKALQGGVAQLVAASVDGEPSTLRSQRAVSPEPSLSTSSVTATMADHPLHAALSDASALSAYRVSLSDALDIFNIQGTKVLEVVTSILITPRPWDSEESVKTIVDATLAQMGPPTLNGNVVGAAEISGYVKEHMRCAEAELRVLRRGMSESSTDPLQFMKAVLERSSQWQFDGSGRIDNAPMLTAAAELSMSLSQQETHILRHLAFCYLPLSHLSFEMISKFRQELFSSAPSAGLDTGKRPCAIITVGPPGCGKSYLMQTRQHNAEFESLPPLSSFANIDPDETVHFTCGGKGKAVEPSYRPYANFLNHENFLAAINTKRNLIFDGSGRDPLNICGRVISRLAPHNYRVVIVIVLCKHQTCVDRGEKRAKITGRATPLGFINMVFKSLQKAAPIYLKQSVSSSSTGPTIAERVLVYKNETEPELCYELGVDSEAQLLQKAVDLAGDMLVMPGDKPRGEVNA